MTKKTEQTLERKMIASVQAALKRGRFRRAALIVDDVPLQTRARIFGDLAQQAFNGRDDEIFGRAKKLIADGKFCAGLAQLNGIRTYTRFEHFDSLRNTARNGLDNRKHRVIKDFVNKGDLLLAARALTLIDNPTRFPSLVQLEKYLKSRLRDYRI